jgi:hypothetical protein
LTIELSTCDLRHVHTMVANVCYDCQIKRNFLTE